MIRTNPGKCFYETLRACCANMACAPFFLLAPVFYSLYYCWPYMAQLPEHINVAIVDCDDSPMSRRMVMSLRASPKLSVVEVTGNRQVAIDAMKAGSIASVIEIPADFEKDVLNDVPTALTLVSNGAFIVKARTTMAGVSDPLEMAAAEAIATHLAQNGMPLSALAREKLQPPPLVIQYMYNTLAGYLNFVVPIVFIIIFQTLMICGTGMLLNDWFHRDKLPEPLRQSLENPIFLAAMQMPVMCICFFWVVAIEGAAFALHGINSFQNIPATLLCGLFFSFAVSGLGVLVGMLFKKSRYVIQAVVTSSIPCVFITGNLYPAANVPVYMRFLAAIVPSTPGADGMLRASQAGASINEIYPYLAHMFLLGSVYFVLAAIVAARAARSIRFASLPNAENARG